jgi:hypothetical protein
MSEKYKFYDPAGMYFVTMSTVGWVDLFTRPELKYVIIDPVGARLQRAAAPSKFAFYLPPCYF